jgi:hypothetical protein
MQRLGPTVLLCGVRPELAEAMTRLHFQDWLPAETVFLEEEVLYELMEANSCAHCGRSERAGADEDALYHLA